MHCSPPWLWHSPNKLSPDPRTCFIQLFKLRTKRKLNSLANDSIQTLRWEWVAILFAKWQSWSPWRRSWWSLWPPEQSFRRRISNDIVRPEHPLSHFHCHTRCRPAGIRSHLERVPVPNLARGAEKVNTGDLVPDLIFDWDVRELLYSW